MTSLRTLNAIATVLHYILAIGFTWFFLYLNHTYPNHPLPGVEISARDHSLQLGTDVSGNITVDWKSTKIATFPVEWVQTMLVSFFVITGSFHLFYYTTDVPNGYYHQAVRNNNNYFRWIEYSVTSTLMLYIMALVTGTKDTGVYMMLLSSNVAMIAMGQWVEESVHYGGSWWLPMATSFLLLVVEFVVIARNLFSRLDEIALFLNANQSNPNVTKFFIPGWLKPMVIVLFLFYISFGFLSLYGAYSGTSYETIEMWYIILSLVAKATLGAFVGYGLGLRQQGLLTPSINL